MGELHTGRLNALKIGKEVTFGTAVVPTSYLKETGFSGDLEVETIESQAHTGSRVSGGVYRVGEMGKLSVPFEADADGVGFFLKGALGDETVTTVSTGEYKHAFSVLNESALPSYTLETTLGGYETKRRAGAVVNSLTLDVAPKALVTGSAEYIYTKEATATPTSLTAPTVRPFIYADGTVTLDAVAFGEVKSLSLSIQNNISTDDYRLNLGGQLASLPAGQFQASGSLTVALNSDSQALADKILDSTPFELKIVLDTGIDIGTAGSIKMEITIPDAMLSAVKRDTGDFLYFTADFAAYDQGAGAITIDLYNAKSGAY